jgi:hypothetical protein
MGLSALSPTCRLRSGQGANSARPSRKWTRARGFVGEGGLVGWLLCVRTSTAPCWGVVCMSAIYRSLVSSCFESVGRQSAVRHRCRSRRPYPKRTKPCRARPQCSALVSEAAPRWVVASDCCTIGVRRGWGFSYYFRRTCAPTRWLVAFTRFDNVPSAVGRDVATSAIGRPDVPTRKSASRRNSAGYFA